MTDSWNRAMRSAFSAARELEPTDEEVQRVLAIDAERVARRDWRPLLRPALAVCAMLAIAAGAFGAPATRAALDDVYGTLTGWVDGDEQTAPGRPLEDGDDAPDWISDSSGDKRLVARNGSVELFAVRDGDTISFALDDSVGISDSEEGWRRQLAGRSVVVLGPGSFTVSRPLDPQDRRPLFGVTSQAVTRVELRYTHGAPTVADGLDGGFVLLADARRQPRELVGYNRAGNQVGRFDVTGLELRVCTDERGCPPGRLSPSI